MQAFRMCDDRYPILDASGAALNGGRWNSKGTPVIYAAETYSLALLETLVHAGFHKIPGGRHYAPLVCPDSIFVESFDPAAHRGWNAGDLVVARSFGDRWLKDGSSAILRVPSVVTQGPEWNLLINPAHRDFSRIEAGPAHPVYWDPRLIGR